MIIIIFLRSLSFIIIIIIVSVSPLSSEIIEIHPDKITFDLTRIALPPKQSSSEYSLIEKMADTFKKNIKTLCYNPHRSQHARPLHVRIRTSQSETSLNWQTDELYLLNITSFGTLNSLLSIIIIVVFFL